MELFAIGTRWSRSYAQLLPVRRRPVCAALPAQPAPLRRTYDIERRTKTFDLVAQEFRARSLPSPRHRRARPNPPLSAWLAAGARLRRLLPCCPYSHPEGRWDADWTVPSHNASRRAAVSWSVGSRRAHACRRYRTSFLDRRLPFRTSTSMMPGDGVESPPAPRGSTATEEPRHLKLASGGRVDRQPFGLDAEDWISRVGSGTGSALDIDGLYRCDYRHWPTPPSPEAMVLALSVPDGAASSGAARSTAAAAQNMLAAWRWASSLDQSMLPTQYASDPWYETELRRFRGPTRPASEAAIGPRRPHTSWRARAMENSRSPRQERQPMG